MRHMYPCLLLLFIQHLEMRREAKPQMAGVLIPGFTLSGLPIHERGGTHQVRKSFYTEGCGGPRVVAATVIFCTTRVPPL